MGNLKAWFLFLVVFLIILVLSGVSIYLYFQNRELNSRLTDLERVKNRQIKNVTAPVVSITPLQQPPDPQLDQKADWETYFSAKAEDTSLRDFSIKYPKSWSRAIEYLGPRGSLGYYTLKISKGDYSINILQGAMGGEVCVFDGDADYNGPSIDLREKYFTELETAIGIIRYYREGNLPSGKFARYGFCQDNRVRLGYFSQPTTIGSISYLVPLSADPAVIREMDEIIKTIK